MDFVQSAGTLDFVEHHDARLSHFAKLQGEQSRVREQRLMACLVQQVDDVGIGESVPRPGALPDAA